MYRQKLVTKNVLGTCDCLGEENNQLLQSRIICKFNDRSIQHYNSSTEMDNLFMKTIPNFDRFLHSGEYKKSYVLIMISQMWLC